MGPIRFAVRVALLAALIALPVAPVAAGGTPPPIGDLLGTWQVKFSGTAIDTDTGAKTKIAEVATWTVTQEDPDRVLIADFGSGLGQDYFARYFADVGLLVIAQHIDVGGPIETRVGYAWVSGSAGKLKLEGRFMLADNNILHRLENTKFSGVRVPPASTAKPLPPVPTAAKAVRDAKAPPAAGDLDGAIFTIALTLKGWGDAGWEKGGEKALMEWDFADQGGGVFDIHMTEPGHEEIVKAFYVDGTLYLGEGDDFAYSTDAVVAILTVTGTAGKLALKGVGVNYVNEGGDDRYIADMKFSGRQTTPQ
jgi:hypothetical protein